MIKNNIFLSALGFLALLILPIYPNSGTLDFGGNVDVSIVYSDAYQSTAHIRYIVRS